MNNNICLRNCVHLISEKYVEKLFGVNKDRMSMDQMAVLLVSNVNESKGHSKYLRMPPHGSHNSL